MSFHLAAYNVDLGTTANTTVNAVTDDVLTITNNNFLPQEDLDIVFAVAMSATLNRARIVSPSNRQVTLPYIIPVKEAAVPGDNCPIANYADNPFRARGLEELGIEATSDIAMGTESCTVLLGLQRTFEPAPIGNIFTLRGTSTTASVADTWTTITKTWDDQLPVGTFAIVGLYGVAATGLANRVILEDQTWRPGAPIVDSNGDAANELFRKGRLGTWGRFKSTARPQIQVLNTAAVSVHTVYLDIVRLS